MVALHGDWSDVLGDDLQALQGPGHTAGHDLWAEGSQGGGEKGEEKERRGRRQRPILNLRSRLFSSVVVLSCCRVLVFLIYVISQSIQRVLFQPERIGPSADINPGSVLDAFSNCSFIQSASKETRYAYISQHAFCVPRF